MIKHIEKIGLVCEFKFINEKLFILTQNEIIDKETNKSLKGNFYCIRKWRNYVLTQNKNEENILILNCNLDFISEITGESNYALWLLNLCDLIPVDDKVFRLTESLKLEETKISIFSKDCRDKFCIRRSKNSVLCYVLENDQLNWKFELGNDINVGGDFILFNKLVIVPTTNQDLIGIEIETGKELWRLSNCNLHYQQQPITNYLVGLSANSFGDNLYQVIDPISGKKIIDKKFPNFFYETTPYNACITSTHYYFISNVMGDGDFKSRRITNLGCINLQSHEIEWIEEIGTTSDRRSEYQKPEIQNNKIYLLDGEQTLHIYRLDD